jgi:hypothetical protein
VGALRRHRAQPAPRRRHPRRPIAHPRRRRDPAPTTDHRARATGPTRPRTRPAPTPPLALGASLATTMDQTIETASATAHPPPPTTKRVGGCGLTPTPPTPIRATPTVEELDRPANPTPPPPHTMINPNQDQSRGSSADRG